MGSELRASRGPWQLHACSAGTATWRPSGTGQGHPYCALPTPPGLPRAQIPTCPPEADPETRLTASSFLGRQWKHLGESRRAAGKEPLLRQLPRGGLEPRPTGKTPRPRQHRTRPPKVVPAVRALVRHLTPVTAVPGRADSQYFPPATKGTEAARRGHQAPHSGWAVGNGAGGGMCWCSPVAGAAGEEGPTVRPWCPVRAAEIKQYGRGARPSKQRTSLSGLISEKQKDSEANLSLISSISHS